MVDILKIAMPAQLLIAQAAAQDYAKEVVRLTVVDAVEDAQVVVVVAEDVVAVVVVEAVMVDVQDIALAVMAVVKGQVDGGMDKKLFFNYIKIKIKQRIIKLQMPSLNDMSIFFQNCYEHQVYDLKDQINELLYDIPKLSYSFYQVYYYMYSLFYQLYVRQIGNLNYSLINQIILYATFLIYQNGIKEQDLIYIKIILKQQYSTLFVTNNFFKKEIQMFLSNFFLRFNKIDEVKEYVG